MLYLDYAKPLADGKYILNFFADSVADLESISHGQKFVTKNGTDYGVPQAGSTVIVTSPNSGKTTYVMDAEGIWVVTEDISYSAVVANPSDAATAKLEKLKVNDTTYANWTQEEIKDIASESGRKYYIHNVFIANNDISATGKLPSLKFKYISKDNTEFSPATNFNYKICFDAILSGTAAPPVYYKVESMNMYAADNTKLEILYFPEYPYSVTSRKSYLYPIADMDINDTVIEL